MKIGKLHLDLKDGIKKEWLISNGIGGFASSTVIGANTRRYHGLLIAPLNPPAKRHLICSKLDEVIIIGEKEYPLYTNICKTYISQGYKKLESFEKNYYPIFNYKVEDVKIQKRICMIREHNTTVVQYNITNGRQQSTLVLSPIVNFRNFHEMSTGKDFMLKQDVAGRKVKIEVNDNTKYPIYINCSQGAYNYYNEDVFRNMYYLKEDERGFFPEENLAVTGSYTIKLEPKAEQTINFVVSLENNIDKINYNKVFDDEQKRIDKLIASTGLIKEKKKYTRQEREKSQVIQDLIIASDTFVINRTLETGVNRRVRKDDDKVEVNKVKKQIKLKSVIAGYPWFLDWGRDTFISFEGLFLVTKRFDDARNVLISFTNDIKSGLIPNGYDECSGKPLYNSVDSSLLLFEAINRYLKYTDDYTFVKNKMYKHLKEIIHSYVGGIKVAKNNIHLTKEGLLSSGSPDIQNTWMDAKIGDYVVTPRNGEAVEVNALFYNSLKTMEHLARKFKDEDELNFAKKYSKRLKDKFLEKFYNPKKKCLNDLVDDDKLRPNQIFALSTTHPIIDLKSEEAKNIFSTITGKLLMAHGLKTLARGEEGYQAQYEGDPVERDMVYHQGPTWVWLLGPYLDSFENMIDAQKDAKAKKDLQSKFNKFTDDIYVTFKKEIYAEEGIGTVSELYDSKLPYKAGGCFSQAWSVSEVLRVILKRDK